MDEKSGSSLPSVGADAKKRRVTYFYEPSIGDHNYGEDHPMKPQRIRMTHNLSVFYGLDRLMEVCVPYPASPDDIRRFHSADYVDFISSVTPAAIVGKKDPALTRRMKKFNIGGDCPVFEGLFGFSQASAGGSIGAAVKLNRGDADIAINWAGGLHHAKKAEASGFCYVNDIVLGILELLKHHKRVLYVDIDIHHGDGVEEAFYTTDRVMTVSFHKFGDYFPGTGHIKDVGRGPGKYYALNAPLSDGIDDESFQGLFRPLIQKVMEVYQPEAVVLQCGADSLAGDKLGCFNLSIRGHASCLHFLRSFNVPLMVLGGGGYTIGNVARCWCYETAVAVNVEPDDRLPINEYCEYFGPDFTLHFEPSKAKNQNSPKDLECIRNVLLEYLSKIQHAPSMQFQARPPDVEPPEEDEEEDMDRRKKRRMWKDENYESETEEDQNPHTCSNPPSVGPSNPSSSAEKRAKGKSVPEEQNSANQAPQEKNFPLKSNWTGGSDLYEILTNPAMMEEWIPQPLKADGGPVRRDDSVEDPEVPQDDMKLKEVSFDEARKLALIKAVQVIHAVRCLCVKDEALEKRLELAEEENELLKVADVEKSWLLKDHSRQREAFEEKLVKSKQNVQDLRKEVKKVEQDLAALQERVRLLEKDCTEFHNRYQSKLNLCCIQTFRIAWEQALLPEQERDIAGPDAYDVLCGFAPGESVKMVERLKASGLNGWKDSLGTSLCK